MMIRHSFDSSMGYTENHPWSLVAYNENEGVLKRERYTDLFLSLNMAEKTNLSLAEFFGSSASEAEFLVERFIKLAEEEAKSKSPIK